MIVKLKPFIKNRIQTVRCIMSSIKLAIMITHSIQIINIVLINLKPMNWKIYLGCYFTRSTEKPRCSMRESFQVENQVLRGFINLDFVYCWYVLFAFWTVPLIIPLEGIFLTKALEAIVDWSFFKDFIFAFFFEFSVKRA